MAWMAQMWRLKMVDRIRYVRALTRSRVAEVGTGSNPGRGHFGHDAGQMSRGLVHMLADGSPRTSCFMHRAHEIAVR